MYTHIYIYYTLQICETLSSIIMNGASNLKYQYLEENNLIIIFTKN